MADSKRVAQTITSNLSLYEHLADIDSLPKINFIHFLWENF